MNELLSCGPLEKAFSICFVLFAFVMFSCWFPTGFSATLSTLAFACAIPLSFRGSGRFELLLFEKLGLILFAWLALSISWSQASLAASLESLSEYRIYFMIPIFARALERVPMAVSVWAIVASVLGGLVALVSSYLLATGMIEIEGAKFSLANRIYHGFVMALLLIPFLAFTLKGPVWQKMVSGLISVSIIYNVLNIEIGRTGYLLVLTILCLFLWWFHFRSVKRSLIFCLILLLCGGVSFFLLERLQIRLIETASNLFHALQGEPVLGASVGLRLEYYQNALEIGLGSPWGGVGIGDMVSTLVGRYESGLMSSVTDNVHSEFLNMLVLGGVPAVILFTSFLYSYGSIGFRCLEKNTYLGWGAVATASVMIVSSLFNSVIKDYGEKHALLLMLSLSAFYFLKEKKRVPQT